MKKYLVALGLGLSLWSCEKQNLAGCVDPSLIDDSAICTYEYNPVCGCDGATYANACEAKLLHGITKYSAGECESKVSCEAIYPADPELQGFLDPISIIDAQLIDDCLRVRYSYAGGCKPHEVRLQLRPIFCGTPPLPPTMVDLLHESHGDPCEAFILGTTYYDITHLQSTTVNKIEFYLMTRDNSFSKRFIYRY